MVALIFYFSFCIKPRGRLDRSEHDIDSVNVCHGNIVSLAVFINVYLDSSHC